MESHPADQTVRITIDGEAGELWSLLDWLRHEEDLRGRVSPQHARVRPGEMGGVLDALAVTMGSGGISAVLASSLSAWLSHRRSDVRIRIKHTDGRSIEFDGKRINAAALVREVTRLLNAEE